MTAKSIWPMRWQWHYYIIDSSITPPNNGDISLGDVNADGQLTTADVLLLAAYSANPSDPSLPTGIGQAVGGGNLVAGALRRLTDHSGWDFSPSWSPDGRHIVFMSYRDEHDNNDHAADIYVMDSDGSNLTRLTDDPTDDRFPSFSPDGRHIVFVSHRAGNEEIYVMGLGWQQPAPANRRPSYRQVSLIFRLMAATSSLRPSALAISIFT